MPLSAGTIAAVVPLALGLVVLVRTTQRRIGGLLVAHGLSVAAVPALADSGVAGAVTAQLTQGAWVFLFLWMALIGYLAPDGHTASRTSRLGIAAGIVGTGLLLVGAAGDAGGFAEAHGGVAAPVRWIPEGVSAVLGTAGLALVVTFLFGSAISVALRVRRATGDVRLQLLWLVWGALSIPAALLVLWVNYFLLGDDPGLTSTVLALTSIVPAAAITVAMVRHRLFDVRVVLSRTLVYGTLSFLVVAVYGLALLGAERAFGSTAPGGVVAVVTVAVAAAPLVAFLSRRIERWVYGFRSEPHEALRLLARRADAAGDDHLSTSITDAVAEAMRVDRVWIDTTETAGTEHVLRIPLVHRGTRLGDLAIAVPPGRTISPADLALLSDLARYAAVIARAEQLNTDLRRSRARIVAAREEERRRLRHDLHDGVGPSLAAMVLKLNAAQSRSDAAERDALIAETRVEVRETITEIRRLVEDLRPPAIDEVGLVGAIRQRAASLSGAVVVEVTGPETLPPLPAAVEVAAFRIASEAMTNVVRHSGASRCRVGITLGATFELTVEDNGHGLGGRTPHGVGWTSMRERAAEVGGSCTISPRSDGGVRVHAALPLVEDGTGAAVPA